MKEFKRLRVFIKPHFKWFSLAFIAMFFYSTLRGFSLALISPLLKVLFGNQGNFQTTGGWPVANIKILLKRYILDLPPLEAVKVIAILIVGVYLLTAIFYYFQRILTAKVQEGITKDVRDTLFSSILRLPLSFFHRMHSGELVSRVINDIGLLRGAVTDGLTVMFREGLTALAYIVVIFLASWRLSLLALVVVPCAALLLSRIGIHLRKRSIRAQEKVASIGKEISESVAGIKVIQGFGTESQAIGRFKKTTRDYYKARLRFEKMGAMGPAMTELLSALVAALILLYGAHLIFISHTLTPERFFVFLAGALSLLQPIKRIATANPTIQQGAAAAKRIFDILGISSLPLKSKGIVFKGLDSEIQFEDMSYEYTIGIHALKNVDFVIRKGEKVALVGPSGAGKTTVADLLARYFDPTSGRILIDGIDLRDYEINSYRAKLSVVPQDPFLFQTTIFENIRYAKPDATEEEVIEASKASAAHKFIVNLKEGYNTILGERGTKISGGERQRIALARALLRNPDILILDEATSSLDSESEEIVKKALERVIRGRTTLLIAHRLSTVLSSDKIVVLDKGKVIDIGRHEELIKRCPLYQRLYLYQFNLVHSSEGVDS